MTDDGYRVACDLCGMVVSGDLRTWQGPEACEKNAGGPHVPPDPEIWGATWKEARREWFRRAEADFEARLASRGSA